MKLRLGRQGRRAVYTRLAEKALGRPLHRDEVVHHKNFDPNDNRLENLEVMINRKHTLLHSQQQKYLRAVAIERARYQWQDDIFWSRLAKINFSEIAA